MKIYKWFMGIDVSKAKLDITLLSGAQKVHYGMIENSEKAIKQFIKELRSIDGFSMTDCLVCMEHTGIYNAHLLAVSQVQKWNLCLESGVQIKQSGGLQRGKNDVIDSYRIALYAFKNQDFLKLWKAPREVVKTLKNLCTVRFRLIEIRKQLENPLMESDIFLNKRISGILQKCCRKSIAAINIDIQETEKQIELVIASDEELKRLFSIVESIPGIGRVSASAIIVTTNEFKGIDDPRKYACYAGVAPFDHLSGSSVRGRNRVSKKANLQVKTLLHLASMVSVKCCDEMRIYYQRKVEAGKNKMSALNAVRNKLIHRVFACVTQNRMYEKNYQPVLV